MDHIKYNVHIKSVSFRRGRYLLVCQDQLLIVKLILGCICYIIFPIFLQLHSINDACIFGCCDKKKKTCCFLEIEMIKRKTLFFPGNRDEVTYIVFILQRNLGLVLSTGI